jgi:hypothetical protein
MENSQLLQANSYSVNQEMPPYSGIRKLISVQEPATGPSLVPVDSSRHPYILSIKIKYNNILKVTIFLNTMTY